MSFATVAAAPTPTDPANATEIPNDEMPELTRDEISKSFALTSFFIFSLIKAIRMTGQSFYLYDFL